MTSDARTKQLSQLAGVLSGRAASLAVTVIDPSLKQQVHRAVLDVEDALRWLDVFSADNRPHLLEIAQLSLTLAEWRVAWIEEVVAAFGSDVMNRE